ncbi:MAG: cytochrome c3 family protein [Desulfuromonadales bacterium]|nr:cytochrome c3 family protein [Desulfuromonadales bacterium]
MKNLAFVVLAVVFSFIPVFLAQQNGIKAPIVKVEVLEEGVYKYEGDSKGSVYFDHNMHIEALDEDCSSCHEGEPAKIEITDMSSGHGACSACHDEVDDMDACSSCHSK